MASTIRIKRSLVSGNPATLAAGELAYSGLTDNGSNGGDRLYIGMGTETSGNAANHFVIGGKYFTDLLDHNKGTLTTSSAIITDADNKIDLLNVDNITLNGSTISTNLTNENLIFAPNGTGKVSFYSQYTFPTTVGSTGQALVYDGAGGLTWAGVTTANTASNISGGTAGSIPYQTASGSTAFINIGPDGTLLRSNGSTATWVSTSTLVVGRALTADAWTTARTISLAGDLGGSVTFDGSSNFTLTATIQADSVALGTDTTGDYVATGATSGYGLTGSTTGENQTFTVTSNATSTNSASTLVYRDASGNFAAGTITANLTGNATSADKWSVARTVTLLGDLTGSAVFDGSSSFSITATIAADSVELGVDTTGNYVATGATSGYGLSGLTNTENATFTVTSNATSTNANNTIVFRDNSGNFAAGTITASLSGNATSADKWSASRTVSLAGDLSGSAIFDGSSNFTITATIAADSVALGTDTTGDYVATGATSGYGLTGSTTGENQTFTVTSNATSTNANSTIVFRNASGNFSAGTITASLSGNATSADKWSTSRTVTLAGDLGGTATFDGSSNFTITATIQADSVTLGTDTTGDYVATGATSGYGLTGSTSGENQAFTVTSNATSTNAANTIVFRNGSGDFAAGTVNAVSAVVTSTQASTSTVASNALYVAGGVGIGGSLYVKGPTVFDSSVVFSGTSTFVYSTNTVYTDNLLNLHAPAGSTGTNHTWLTDDGKDIGFVFHYYKSTDKDAFLGLANDTGYLEWYSDGLENMETGVFTASTYGIFKTGGIVLVNTTASISTQSGALTVAGGVGIGGNLYVGGTIYGTINGSITTATNIAGGTAGQLVYQSAAGVTTFAGPGTAGQILVSNGTSGPQYTNTSSIHVYKSTIANQWTTARTVTFTGDTTGTFTIDGSADVTSVNLTIQPDSVTLGTDTTGDYVATGATSGYGLTGSTTGENQTFTVTSNATSTNANSTLVFRDGSGNFAAGTITANLTGNATSADKWSTSRTVSLAGDLSGSATFDGSSNFTITATIAADSVTLGTDTTGDYVATGATSGYGLTGSTTGENQTFTVTSNATSTNANSTIVFRDNSGNFSAGTITASLSGNATSADKWSSLRTISLAGDLSGSGVFDGSSNFTVTATIAANSVELGTDTTGNYVATGATSGYGLSGSSSSENGSFTVTSNATSTNATSTMVFRDGSGNFAAGTITASLDGTAALTTNIANGGANQIVYQSGANLTSFLATGNHGQVLQVVNTATGAFAWGDIDGGTY